MILVEQPACAIGHPGRVHGAQTVERRLEPNRERLVGEILVRPHGVASVVGDLPGLEQRVGRRRGQIAEVAVPGVGEVQGIGGLLDHADHVGAVLQRVHEGRHVAAAQQVGHPLEGIEVELLVGQEDDQVVGQGPAQLVQLGRLGHPGQLDTRHRRPQGAGHRLDRQRRPPGRRHLDPCLRRGRGARPRCARRSAPGSARRSPPRQRRRPRRAACRPRGAGSRSRT